MAGTPRSVPAGPVAAHVRALLGRGLTLRQIGRESGVQPSTVRRLAGGQETVWAATAEKLLAVPLDVRVSLGDVPSLGAVRRVRALYALGHFNHVIASEAGISKDAVCALTAAAWPTVKVEVDSGVRKAYDRLSMSTGTSGKTLAWAKRHGWVSPLAWDDDTIDDPNAVPQTDAPEPIATEGENVADRWIHGESVVLGSEDRKQVLQHLMEWTSHTPQEIAGQLEISLHTLWQTWSRLKKQARQEGRTEPWRRVYVPRERDLKQTEMGEAA
jgi:transcriptional regulator with XRE-family HTH domain